MNNQRDICFELISVCLQSGHGASFALDEWKIGLCLVPQHSFPVLLKFLRERTLLFGQKLLLDQGPC